jgi:hypothetical protein
MLNKVVAMIEFRKVKSDFYVDYHIMQDGHFIGYIYRGTRSSYYRIVLYNGSHQTQLKNVRPVKTLVKGLLQCMN